MVVQGFIQDVSGVNSEHTTSMASVPPSRSVRRKCQLDALPFVYDPAISLAQKRARVEPMRREGEYRLIHGCHTALKRSVSSNDLNAAAHQLITYDVRTALIYTVRWALNCELR